MIGEIKPFNSIGRDEADMVDNVMGSPLSGYLAGRERGGLWVRALEGAWAKTFHVKHAIACNSATSGLMAAAFAACLKTGDQFICPAMTMSATAAAPMFTGATPVFCDVDERNFCLDPGSPTLTQDAKAIFLTHLFGQAIDESWWTGWGRQNGMTVIVDAAQAPLAMEDGVYSGTTADIGVFSLNVHKPIQCGEGGMIVTNDSHLADRMRAFINHGEHAGRLDVGLNLRMPEVCAAIALVQLHRGEEIIQTRIDQATAIIAAIGNITGIRPPYVHPTCRHVYYTIPFLIEDHRDEFVVALRDQGVPVVDGYVDPLYRMPAFARFARPCPVAEDLHDRRLFYIENCAWDFTLAQCEQIGDAFRKAAEKVL